MADGGVVSLSLVQRALTPEHWRRWRKKLPKELREEMYSKPPADVGVAWEMARRLLRRRRAMIRAEDTPSLSVRFSDLAVVAGRDRGTIASWAEESPDVRTERGAVVIPGDLVLAHAQDRGVAVSDVPGAIAWLKQQLHDRKNGPPLTWSTPPLVDPIATFTPFPILRSGQDPTVDELASLVGDTMPFEPGSVKRARGIRVRALLAEHGLALGASEPVPRAWLRSEAGQRFMLNAWLANENGQRWLSSTDGRQWLKGSEGRVWLAGPDGQRWVKKGQEAQTQ